MNHQKTIRHKGFTLVEMLVVIAIIGTLAAIAFPITRSVINKGKTEESKLRMKEFTAAIEAYNNENGRLPYPGDDHPNEDTELSESQQVDMMKVLLNLDDDYSSGTSYLKMPTAKSGRNGIVYKDNKITGFRDGWGSPYFMKIDFDLDGEIDQSKGSANLEKKIKSKKYILISPGMNGKLGGDEEDDIGNW